MIAPGSVDADTLKQQLIEELEKQKKVNHINFLLYVCLCHIKLHIITFLEMMINETQRNSS